MKLRVSVVEYLGDARHRSRDATLTCDATATVGEVARGLVRGGAGHPGLLPCALHRWAPLTLRATMPGGERLMLDPGDLVSRSGLIAGSLVEPVLEAQEGGARRVRPPVASLTVLTGEQQHSVFLATSAETTVGRDRSNRVELHDAGVSRRHAVLRRTADAIEIEDLGSANGTALVTAHGADRRGDRGVIRIRGAAIVAFGPVRVRVEMGPPPEPFEASASAPAVTRLQSPRVDPVYAPDPVVLPAPPDAETSARFPAIAMFAPLLMGGVLYATTQSLMSLVFVGLSPLLMLGSWLDSRLTRRSAARASERDFAEHLAAATEELAANAPAEREARERETPAAGALASLAASRDPRLWSRRPEHRAFLELRLGTASLPCRMEVQLPPQGSSSLGHWERLTAVRRRFAAIDSVPLLERLERCGSVGIAGDPIWAGSAARGLLVQALALHAPAHLVLTAFAGAEEAAGEWAWLPWLPHVASAYSPIPGVHLAADERSAVTLLTSLEGLIAERSAARGAPGAPTIRSRTRAAAADAQERLAPADRIPPHPAIFVLVLPGTRADLTRLVGLAEDGPDVGVHVIWVASHLGAVPAACRTVVEAHADTWRAHFVRQGETVTLSALDGLDLPATQTFARELAPVIDLGARVLDESDLPRSIGLAQLVPGDILGSSEAILARWRENDSLFSGWRPGVERDAGRLAAVVGQGGSGPVEIDLRAQGPHALVGGTTGSGKSEFLQTWILSLATNYAPDRLTFLLVDYKGGAAFADCVTLPHTVGLVTDLTAHLVRRALVSLRAELHSRERLLAEKGAKDLMALERRGDPEAPPALVIVIDEFAALTRDVPEFIDGVIDVAQRGRSLGLHLVLATQRPAGVVTDPLRANTNLRVALRMADPADSSDVIGVADAAYFSPGAPGRAALKIGAGRLTHLQTAYLGGRAENEHREVLEIHDLGFGEPAPWSLLPEGRRSQARHRGGARDIETLAQHIRAAAVTAGTAVPRRPWVDHLPETLPLASGLLAAPTGGGPDSARGGITLGLIDTPQAQRQSPYTLRLAETGNLAIFGGVGSGKTTALITLAISAISTHPHIQIYGIDCGTGLRGLGAFPHTGDIVPGDERDRVVRLLRHCRASIAERASSGRSDPPLLLLLDGLAAFRDAHEHRATGADPFADLVEIAASGRGAGVHIALTSERANGLPVSLAASIPERLALRLSSEADAHTLGVPGAALLHAAPGRAIRIGTDEEIQIALPGASADPADTEAAMTAHAARVDLPEALLPATIPAVPDTIARAAIRAVGTGSAPFAIDTEHLEPVSAPASGLALVTGPSGSGRTTAIRAIIEAIRADAQRAGATLDAVLLSPRRSSLSTACAWSRFADDDTSRAREIERLSRQLGGAAPRARGLADPPPIGAPFIGGDPAPTPRTALADQPGPAPTPPFPAAGGRGLVVIEDIGGFDGSGSERALGALLKLLRRSEVTTIVEGENATLSSVWELASPLRGARWILALQPDANDTPSVVTTPFTHAKRADFAPGRGYLVTQGRATGIHVGMPASAV